MATTSSREVYNSGAWKRARARVLERDGFECQIRGPKCSGRATDADHVIELQAGGHPFDLSNLRAACGPCNRPRGDRGPSASREW